MSTERKTWVAVLLWTVYAVLVVGLMVNGKRDDQIYSVYHDAGQRWIDGEPLYDGTGWGFIYLPHSAMVFAPFACLPYRLAATLCRLLNLLVFFIGVWRFTGLAELRRQRALFLWMSLLVMPLILTSARHAQMTLAMGAMMLLAVADLVESRWNRAALFLTLGLALKPLIVVLMLLVAVLYPRVSWRLLIGVLVLLVLPFLTQRPTYVATQYRECFQMFDDAQKYALTHPGEYAQLFWMLQSFGVDVPSFGQTVLRIVAALLTLGVALALQSRLPAARFGIVLLTLAVFYLLLFNPRTERNTYSLLAPSLALFTVQAMRSRRFGQATVLFGCAVLFVFSYEIGKVFFGSPTVWIKPLLALVVLATMARQVVCETEANGFSSEGAFFLSPGQRPGR
jgi:alpha-1,2-mannosyltransferase